MNKSEISADRVHMTLTYFGNFALVYSQICENQYKLSLKFGPAYSSGANRISTAFYSTKSKCVYLTHFPQFAQIN